MRNRSLGIYIAFFLILALQTFDAKAAEVEYEISVGATNSDNIGRSEDQEIEEDYALLGLDLDYSFESNRTAFGFRSDLEYRNYLDSVFSNETVGSVDANLEIELAPGYVIWVAEDFLRTISGDAFRPDTAANRENVNQFSTGPDISVRLGSKTSLTIAGRYRINSFESSDIDSDALDGRIALVRRLNQFRSLSLNLSADRVEYDNTLINSNYDRQTAYLGFLSEVTKGTLSVNLGVNEVHDSGDTFRGTFADLSFDRELSQRSSIALTYGQQISDAGNIFSLLQDPGQPFGDSISLITTGELFESRRASIRYRFSYDKTDFSTSILRRDESYETQIANDRDWTEFRAGVSRELGSGWQIGLNAGFTKVRFDESDREDDDAFYRARISRRFGRTLSVNLAFARFDRDSNESAADYVENTVSLTFAYSR